MAGKNKGRNLFSSDEKKDLLKYVEKLVDKDVKISLG